MNDPFDDLDPYMPPPNLGGMAMVLKDHDVDFVVFGGAAAQAWGAVRRPADLDVVIRCAPDNWQATADALVELNARAYFPEFSHEELDRLPSTRITPELIGWSPISTWMTPHGELDLFDSVLTRDGSPRYYEDLIDGSVRRRIGGIPVDVMALDTLITSKLAFARPKDHEVIAELRAVARHLALQQSPGQTPHQSEFAELVASLEKANVSHTISTSQTQRWWSPSPGPQPVGQQSIIRLDPGTGNLMRAVDVLRRHGFADATVDDLASGEFSLTTPNGNGLTVSARPGQQRQASHGVGPSM